MGGMTYLYLKDTTEQNIARHNAKLEVLGVPKKYRFYSRNDVILEYEYFLAQKGSYPEHLFPKNKINSFEDFQKFWNTKNLGECFVPKFGSLLLDVYFGRTSKRSMRLIARHFVDNIEEFDSVNGSFSTFLERGFNRQQIEVVKKHGFD